MFGKVLADVMERPAKGAVIADALGASGRLPAGIFANKRTANEAPPRAAEREAAGRGAILAEAVGERQSPSHWTNEGFEPLQSAAPAVANAGPLGSSMRQPFDYDAALAKLAGEQKRPKWWQYGLAALGDTLARQSGSEPYAVRSLAAQQQDRASRMQDAVEQITKWRQEDYARQHDADLRAANPRTIGRDLVQFDPAAGRANVLFDGPEDPEIYADSLGFDRGTDEWFAAVEDYVLRSNGPSAHARDLELDDRRTVNDRGLEAYRQDNRVSLEELRQRGRSTMEDARQQNRLTLRKTPSAGRAAIVNVSTPQEAKRLPTGTRFRTPDGQVKVRP